MLSTVEPVYITDITFSSAQHVSAPIAASMTYQYVSETNGSFDDMSVTSNNATVPSAVYGPGTGFVGVLMSIGVAGSIANGLMLIGKLCLQFGF